MRTRPNARTPPATPVVFCASSHKEAEKAIVSQLKLSLHERGVTLSSRQVGRPGNEQVPTTVGDLVRLAQVILVILSPEACASRHVRVAMEAARRYQRPVYGIWIAGERWHRCGPGGSRSRTHAMPAPYQASAPLLLRRVRADQ